MRVLLIGASGRTGQLTLTYALNAGLTVTALVRRSSSIEQQTGLQIVEGTPLEEQDITAAFDAVPDDPVQAVVITLAASRTSDNPWAKPVSPQWLMRDVVRAVLPHMRARGIKRIVVMSAFGCGSSWAQFPWTFKQLFLHSNMILGLRDHDAVDEELRHAAQEWGLEWTAARPTLLKGEGTAVREFGEDGKGIGMFHSCAREGVAFWMIGAVTKGTYITQAVALAT